MTAAEQLAQEQLAKLREDRENQSIKDEMMFKGKIQEALGGNRCPWPKYDDKKNQISNEALLRQIMSNTLQAAGTCLVMSVAANLKTNINKYISLIKKSTQVDEAIKLFATIDSSEEGDFGRNYRLNMYLKCFDAALHSQLMQIMASHHGISGILTTSDNHHWSAGLTGKSSEINGMCESGLILFLTIKQALQSESTLEVERAKAFIRDNDDVGSNRPVKLGQLLKWMQDMRKQWSFCPTDVSESELTELTQTAIQRIFPVSRGFDTLGTLINGLVASKNVTWDNLNTEVTKCLDNIKVNFPDLLREPKHWGVMKQGVTYILNKKDKPWKKQFAAAEENAEAWYPEWNDPNQESWKQNESWEQQTEHPLDSEYFGTQDQYNQEPYWNPESQQYEYWNDEWSQNAFGKKGGKKGKGKGKGKGDGKGKNGFAPGSCMICGSMEHWAASCPKGSKKGGKKGDKKGGKKGKPKGGKFGYKGKKGFDKGLKGKGKSQHEYSEGQANDGTWYDPWSNSSNEWWNNADWTGTSSEYWPQYDSQNWNSLNQSDFQYWNSYSPDNSWWQNHDWYSYGTDGNEYGTSQYASKEAYAEPPRPSPPTVPMPAHSSLSAVPGYVANNWKVVPARNERREYVPVSGPARPMTGQQFLPRNGYYRQTMYKEPITCQNRFSVLEQYDQFLTEYDGDGDLYTETLPTFFTPPTVRVTGISKNADIPEGTFATKQRKKKSRKVDGSGNRVASKVLKGIAEPSSYASVENDGANVGTSEEYQQNSNSTQPDRMDEIKDAIRRAIRSKQEARQKGYVPDTTPYLMVDSGANLSNFVEPQSQYYFPEPRKLSTMGGQVSIDRGGSIPFSHTNLHGTFNEFAENILSLIDADEGAQFDYIQSSRGFGIPGSEGAWMISPFGNAYQLYEVDRLKFLTRSDLELMQHEANFYGFKPALHDFSSPWNSNLEQHIFKGSTRKLKPFPKDKVVSLKDLVDSFSLTDKDFRRLGGMRSRVSRKEPTRISTFDAFSAATDQYGKHWSCDSFETESTNLKFGTIFVEKSTSRLKVGFKKQNEAPETLSNFVDCIDKEHIMAMLTLKSDNGSEFLGGFHRNFDNSKVAKGMLMPKHISSIPEHSNSNSRAESNINVLKVQSLGNLESSGLPSFFTLHAMKYTQQTLNRNRLEKFHPVGSDEHHIVSDLFGPKKLMFGEVVIFKSTDTDKKRSQDSGELTSRGKLGLFLEYARFRSAIVLDLEKLKRGIIRLSRSATFVALEQPQTARDLVRNICRLYDFKSAIGQRPSNDAHSDSSSETGGRYVQFDDDSDGGFEIIRLEPRNDDTDEFDAVGDVGGGVFSDDESENLIDQDDPAEHFGYGVDEHGIADSPAAPEAADIEDDFCPSPVQFDIDHQSEHSEPSVHSEPSERSGPVAPPQAVFAPNYGPARAPPPMSRRWEPIFDRGLIYDVQRMWRNRTVADGTYVPWDGIGFDDSGDFDRDSFHDDQELPSLDFNGRARPGHQLYAREIAHDLVRFEQDYLYGLPFGPDDFVFQPYPIFGEALDASYIELRQCGHRILSKHDPEFWDEKMKKARMSEWETFIKMELFSLKEADQMEWELKSAGELVARDVTVSTIKNEGEASEKRKCRITADGGPLRSSNTRLVVPINNSEKRIIMVRGKCLGNEIGVSDVQNAYLHAKVSARIWFRVPDIICDDLGIARGTCKLLDKSLYGLPDSHAQFDEHTEYVLQLIGFRKISPSIYQRELIRSDGTLRFDEIGTITDDFIISSPSVSSLVEEIRNAGLTIPEYELMVPGMSTIKYNGVEHDLITIQDGTVLLKEHMFNYMKTLVDKCKSLFGKTHFRRVETPFTKVSDEDFDKPSRLMENLVPGNFEIDPHGIVASLLFAARSARPDLAEIVNTLSTQIHKWSLGSDKLLERAVAYCSHHLERGLINPWSELEGSDVNKLSLISQSDANLAGCRDSNKSTSGYFLFCTGEFGNWKFTLESGCKRASIICDSTPLAELLGISLGSKRVCVLKSTMEDLQRVEVPIVFESDSQTSLKIIQDGYSSKLSTVSRSIRLTISTLHQLLHTGANSARYVDTTRNCADIVSKGFVNRFPDCIFDVML